MSSSSNNKLASAGASSTLGLLTDISPRANSTTGSHALTMASQPREQPCQLLAYLAQSATEDSSPYGRLATANQHKAAGLDGCIELLYTGRAEQASVRFDEQFRRGPA
ncbi:hypothetical protein B0I37DRAFT_429716 [Chaetomium sp. MPI-CAGE-AT-0009]|nr:hypothetical protein B0I37DRAFT_429716 [Chaetomium sp. MPI-CAGE-AT-0009]